ncbi:hypothetical protein CC85DRAFT_284461 [Cutaneotrichosporon oleaginosum]|uniref:Protein PNS1 n=1 Tax=Cutaneotrichosporon oleaginosum TaxID=879819 RepID=A0A0J1B737_9TREE|nr:uncharacterized protein CC85DRAFT_284461 [Cutaneotrichosporon oleaginosum]KLT43539.1 hypothetical protein CC85DRAFT_284461 [Cutaneotrichosporon oleaginosum]TXT05562.1 hypothetical protein COLE_06882 [Cutaneotrichosporon oleaginosum]
MSTSPQGHASGAASLSAYASKFLAGSRSGGDGLDSPQPSRSTSPPHPFLPSPTPSETRSRLTESRTPSPPGTPPFPGPGLDGIPSISDMQASSVDQSGIGVGLLFDAPGGSQAVRRDSRPARHAHIPDPYGVSSDSEGELEPDLDQVAKVRRSLLKPNPPAPKDGRSRKGWLAHQSVFPPSSSSSEASESDKETEDESIVNGSGLMGRSRRLPTLAAPNPDSTAYQDALNEPLLGPDEIAQLTTRVPVRLQVYRGRFAHWEREGLRKYKDPAFLALWLTTLLGVLFSLLFVWGSSDPPPGVPRRGPPVLSLLPMLMALLIPTFILPPVFLFLLHNTVRPVLVATAGAIPFSLFICGWWALGASFEGVDDIERGERWWATTGMRLFAVALWIVAALFARLVWVRRRRLAQTVSVVELSTSLLLRHQPLLVLTPLLLVVFAVTSIPFMTLLIRLGMYGYWRQPREGTWAFHLQPWAGWLIVIVTLVWLWTWGVIRGVGRVAVAAVVGEWYFHRGDGVEPFEITLAAVHRATGPSLGSVCLGSLIVATMRFIGRTAAEMKRITSPRSRVLPNALSFLSSLTPIFSIIASVLDQANSYALVYVGVTGEPFWPSARRAVGLTNRRNSGKLLDYTLIKLLLTLISAATGLFTATMGYLYMTHSLGRPGYAPLAALLCGGVPFVAMRAATAVLADAADALFICHQIDGETGGGHCDEAKDAFEGATFRDDAIV